MNIFKCVCIITVPVLEFLHLPQSICEEHKCLSSRPGGVFYKSFDGYDMSGVELKESLLWETVLLAGGVLLLFQVHLFWCRE